MIDINFRRKFIGTINATDYTPGEINVPTTSRHATPGYTCVPITQ